MVRPQPLRYRYPQRRVLRANRWARLRYLRAIQMRKPVAAIDPAMRKYLTPQMRFRMHRRFRQGREAR